MKATNLNCLAIGAAITLSLALGDSASAAGAASELSVVKPARACADLGAFDPTPVGGPGSRIASAKEGLDRGVAICKVEGVLAPEIRFTVELPLSGWTQRYLQVGCGGLCGRVSLEVGAAEGCAPLDAGGFVLAATDMGHEGMSGDFGADPQKRVDFAYRAQHLTAVVAKALIRAYYGQAVRFSYFNGCSDGGREALIEAQRFPDDFDGVLAGAAAMNFEVQNALYHAWLAQTNRDAEGKAILIASRLPVLHKAALAQCAGKPDPGDPLIVDPRTCHFDPGVAECPPDQAAAGAANCLTAAEVEAARRVYAGPRDPVTGERLAVGGPQPGSELGWAGVFVPQTADQPPFSEMIALDAIRYLALPTNPSPATSLRDVKIDRAWLDALRALHPLYDATNPDLSAFAARGGKLILWHGWADEHISPLNAIAYHEAVVALMGKARAAEFERLYLFPGVKHCGGGEGPNGFDLLTPIMNWVEQDRAPDVIVAQSGPEAARANGFGAPVDQPPFANRPAEAGEAATAPQSRPVFPYPDVALYSGPGDPADAASYIRAPSTPIPVADWAGADFYRPYQALER